MGAAHHDEFALRNPHKVIRSSKYLTNLLKIDQNLIKNIANNTALDASSKKLKKHIRVGGDSKTGIQKQFN